MAQAVESQLALIKGEANSFLQLLSSGGATEFDIKHRLEKMAASVSQLVEMRNAQRDLGAQSPPSLASELGEAYAAVSKAAAPFNSKQRPDLFRLAERVNYLLLSVDALPRTTK